MGHKEKGRGGCGIERKTEGESDIERQTKRTIDTELHSPFNFSSLLNY